MRVPDAEPLVQSYLASALGVRVTTAGVPDGWDFTAPLVTVSRTGTWSVGQDSAEFVDRPVITVKSWAPTVPGARELSTSVRALMLGIISQPYFSAASETSRYQSSGTEGEAQYVGVYPLVLSGRV